MLQEFKKFAMKGNVMDLAVGVVIGAAFGKIVTSLVNDVLTPIIGLLVGGVNFERLILPLYGEAKIYIGTFLQTVFDFLIVSFSIFLFVRFMNRFKKKEEEKIEAKIDKSEELLAEIRDLLKDQAGHLPQRKNEI
jgi:large conductance mechanosensitive channel